MSFTKEEILDLYNAKELSIREIAKMKGVSRTIVRYYMKKFGIPRRKGNQPIVFSYEEIYKLYVEKRLSVNQIAKQLGCSWHTLANFLRKSDIKIRSRNEALKGRRMTVTKTFLANARKNQRKRWASIRENPPFTKEELERLYIEYGLSTREIGKIKNESHRRVLSWMNRYAIKRRSLSNAKKMYIKIHPEYLSQLILNGQGSCIEPNKGEQKLLNLLNRQDLPFIYTGDGSILVGGLSPDFLSLEHKAVIEYFGQYWHKPEDEQKRINAFRRLGYNCLVIWDYELQNESHLIDKIHKWWNIEEAD